MEADLFSLSSFPDAQKPSLKGWAVRKQKGLGFRETLTRRGTQGLTARIVNTVLSWTPKQ